MKHTFHLEVGQVAALRALHPNLKIAAVLRQLVGAYISQAEARAKLRDLSDLPEARL